MGPSEDEIRDALRCEASRLREVPPLSLPAAALNRAAQPTGGASGTREGRRRRGPGSSDAVSAGISGSASDSVGPAEPAVQPDARFDWSSECRQNPRIMRNAGHCIVLRDAGLGHCHAGLAKRRLTVRAGIVRRVDRWESRGTRTCDVGT